MTARRVVVTGLGAITSLGHNVKEFRESIFAGRSGIRPLTCAETSKLRFTNGAEVVGFQPEDHFDAKLLDQLDRFTQFGLVAAEEAVRSSGLEITPEVKPRVGVVTGAAIGGKYFEEQAYSGLFANTRRPHPLTIPRGMSNAAASQIAMRLGFTGPVLNVSTACASANHAIAQAVMMLRLNVADVILAGGCEAPLLPGHLKMWEGLRVVSSDTCRPFSKDRKGMILGEGGAMLLLEDLDHAKSRGAMILGEVAGFGMSADAHHLTQPSAAGAAQAIDAALRDANIQPAQVGYVNAHGTGTLINDSTETEALRIVFREHADQLAVSSTKSMHGHTLGAAGAIEAVATVLALKEGVLPPTANFTEPDPACDLDVIPNEARRAQVEYAISNSFAFGGLNAVLVFKRWD